MNPRLLLDGINVLPCFKCLADAGGEGDEASSSISTLERSLAARRGTRGKMMIPIDTQPSNTRKSPKVCVVQDTVEPRKSCNEQRHNDVLC